MSTRAPSVGQLAIVVVFALSCFGIGLFVWTTFGGKVPLQPAGYRIHVLFGAEATQLTQGSEVRISGVRVGEVVRTDPRGRRIDALIELERRFAPLPADARAIVRFKTLLGESFVELTPGTKAGPDVPENGRLTTANVASTATVDEVLATFDRPTRRAFKAFLNDLATATKGRGDELNAVLGNAAPTASELKRLAVVLDAEGPALSTLVRDSGRALDRIGRRAQDVKTLVGAGRDVLQTTAAQDRALTETVRVLPGFLRRLERTMAQVDLAAQDAAPALRTLRPVAPLVRPALDGTVALTPVLRTTFRRLDPILRASSRTLPALRRTLRASKPLFDVLHPAGRDLVPVLQLLELYRDDVVGSLANGAAAAKGTIDGKHVVRIALPINAQSRLGADERDGGSRWNPYYAPGTALDLWQGIGAQDCRQTENREIPLGRFPPCLQARPWTFQGNTRQYPHVQENAP